MHSPYDRWSWRDRYIVDRLFLLLDAEEVCQPGAALALAAGPGTPRSAQPLPALCLLGEENHRHLMRLKILLTGTMCAVCRPSRVLAVPAAQRACMRTLRTMKKLQQDLLAPSSSKLPSRRWKDLTMMLRVCQRHPLRGRTWHRLLLHRGFYHRRRDHRRGPTPRHRHH